MNQESPASVLRMVILSAQLLSVYADKMRALYPDGSPYKGLLLKATEKADKVTDQMGILIAKMQREARKPGFDAMVDELQSDNIKATLPHIINMALAYGDINVPCDLLEKDLFELSKM